MCILGEGFSIAYRQNKLFGSFIWRVCSLSFVLSFLVSLAMVIITDYTTKLTVEDLKVGTFATELVKYIEDTWFTKY